MTNYAIFDIDHTFSLFPDVSDWAEGYFGQNDEAVLMVKQAVMTGLTPIYISQRDRTQNSLFEDFRAEAGLPFGVLYQRLGTDTRDIQSVTRWLMTCFMARHKRDSIHFAMSSHQDVRDVMEELDIFTIPAPEMESVR